MSDVEKRDDGKRGEGDVTIRQGGAREVNAHEVTIRQGGAVRVRADEVEITQGGVALAQRDDARDLLAVARPVPAAAVLPLRHPVQC